MRSVSEALRLPKYDPLDPAVMADPYPTYAMLRAAGGICRGGPGLWVVTRHADVAALLKSPRLANHFSAEEARFSFGDSGLFSFFERIILNVSPPRHTLLRKLMGTAFSPVRVRALTATITGLVDELLVPILDRRQFEVVNDLAIPLPVRVVCALIGIPHEDLYIVHPRAALLCKAFSMRVPEHERAEVDGALQWLREYIGNTVREREARPGDDLLSMMLEAVSDTGGLTREAVIDNVVFLFFAGFDTTRNLIATGCAALGGHPDQFARLVGDPALVPRAVDEFLRYDAPIQAAGRRVLEPIEIDGCLIRRDRLLSLLLGSANHDEAVFDHPEELDIGRSPNPHVSFGGGIHFCLGALLARTEAMAVFGRFRARFATLEPDGLPIRALNPSFRSYAHVPMRVQPA